MHEQRVVRGPWGERSIEGLPGYDPAEEAARRSSSLRFADTERRQRPPLGPGNALTPAVGVWILVAVTAAAATALHANAVQQLTPLPAELRVPWWALALLFALAELCVIRLEFRRDSHTFTLSEFPLVAGLLLGTPAGLLAGRLLGAAVLLVRERRRPIKVAFNLSLFALETAVASIVLRTVMGEASPFSPLGLVGVFAATLAATLVSVALVFVVISISEHSFEPRQLGVAAAIGTTITAANTGIAVVAVQAVSSQLTFGLLLVVPAAVVFAAYRALVAAREKHSRLEFLHETSRLVARSPKLDRGLQDVLAHTRTTFRAEVAEIVLAPADGTGTALRTFVGPGDERAALEPFELEADHLSARVLADRRPILFAAGDAAKELREHLGAELRDAVIVPLSGERKVLGTLLVGSRLGGVGTFSAEDLKLLQTLARQLGVSIENARLGTTLGRLTELTEALEHQAFHDPLTGLANRALFTERLQHAVARQNRAGSLLAVLFVDIDDFKAVNDLRGHQAGDELLVAVAGRICACLREADTAARLGGDEFAILLENLATDYDAEPVAERIVAAFGQPFQIRGEAVYVSASVGVALAGEPESLDNVLANADVAMYRAKARGKAQYTVFEPAMRAELFRPIELRRDLQRAIDQGEFMLHYQPIVSLATGRLEGVEALLRWQAAGQGLVPPGEFVPLAEDTGLIGHIGRWALQEACRKPRAWEAEYADDKPLWISVNISRRQLERPELVDDVADALEASRLDPYRLVLEITESIASFDDKTMKALLERLKELGVRLALDDFGSGYSSLGRLQAMPLDMLKLDRQFVESVDSTLQSTQLTKAIIELGRTLGLTTVAEGIERRDQLDLLVSLGCDLGQGFLLAQPLDVNGIDALLSQQAPERGPAAEEPSRAFLQTL